MLNGLDLFSGIGGITLGLQEYVRPVAYCENEPYAQAVLLSRMRENRLPLAPIWDDVRTLKGAQIGTPVDIIYGGFPCQDISVAGLGAGLEGERSGLFFEIIRLVRELRPSYIFLENVAAITIRGLDRVLLEFTALGYDSRWTIVSAAEIGAPHVRERWFLLAHSNSERIWEQSIKQPKCSDKAEPLNFSENSNATSEGLERRKQSKTSRTTLRKSSNIDKQDNWWSSEPNVGRVVNGLPKRLDRIRSLGNAVVPAQVKEAFERLCGLNDS